MIEAIILAAGKGTRMNSKLPKVMHLLAGKPFIEHVVDTAEATPQSQIHLVLGHGAETVQTHFSDRSLNIVLQEQQLGTGHAVSQALPYLKEDSIALILYGDVPLIKAETLNRLTAKVSDNAMALLTVTLDNPKGYGRILRDKLGRVTSIVEEKDASEAEKAVTEVNTGIMAVTTKKLQEWLPKLSSNNAQDEYYLTDIIEMASLDRIDVIAIQAETEYEVQGVNDRAQQAKLERQAQRLIAEDLMAKGVTLLDPERFDCRGEVITGSDCIIDINCIFEGKVVLGDNVNIGPNCCIKNTSIGDGSIILANTVIEESVIEGSCNIGPFARIRPESKLADGSKIGNFVETKKMNLGKGSKINHLSYVGDAEIGANVNIGAGTITCNYDGVNKSKTIIEDDVFVGSNTALVAPVTIGKKATIAAGSTITNSVDADALAIARQRQRKIIGWQRPTKKS